MKRFLHYNARSVDEGAETFHCCFEPVARLGRGTAAIGIVRRIGRSGSVQGSEERAESPGFPARIIETNVGSNVTVEPGADAPLPRVPVVRLAEAHRSRNRYGEAEREFRQPSMLVGDEIGPEPAARHADRERRVVTSLEAEDRVVPTVRDRHEPTCGQVGMLLGEELSDEVLGDIDLGGRHVLHHHQIDATRSVGFELGKVQQA